MFPILLNEAKEDRKMSWPGANAWENACEEETREEEISLQVTRGHRTIPQSTAVMAKVYVFL